MSNKSQIFNNSIIDSDINEIINSGINWYLFNNKRVFFTGSTGMLVSYMVYVLIYLNETIDSFKTDIVVCVRSIEKCKEKFGRFIGRSYFHIFESDINFEIKYNEKIDFIVHGASIAVTQLFQIKPVEVIKPNVLGTYNLLEFGKKNSIEGFLFFSSVSIYGETNEDINEQNYGVINPLDDNSCYTESKRLGETLCKAFSKEYGLKTKIARIAHTYGPTLDLANDQRVFADFIRNIVNNNNIILKSDGLSMRSFCYLSDATEAFFRILLNGESGEAYNVCNTKQKISIIELANILVNLYPEKNLKVIKHRRDISEKYTEYKNNDVSILNDKLKSIGWNPKHDIKNGFNRTIESILENLGV